jgi:molybdopterin-guanine dinucleotide biosynthesis protein A
LSQACARVAVVCKRDTALPPLAPGVERWDEPDEPRHPAAGVVHALERLDETVLVCAADMPFVTQGVCRQLADAAAKAPQAAAVVAEAAGWLQPTFAVYRPGAVEALRASGNSQLRRLVQSLGPLRVSVPAGSMRSVDTPQALAAAERELSARAAARRAPR